jgi:hypothetical protein
MEDLKIAIPLIVRSHPKTIRNEIVSEMPMASPRLMPPRAELAIVGGPFHDFIKGFGYRPYQLVIKKVQQPEDSEGFHLVFESTRRVLQTCKSEFWFKVFYKHYWGFLIWKADKKRKRKRKV